MRVKILKLHQPLAQCVASGAVKKIQFKDCRYSEGDLLGICASHYSLRKWLSISQTYELPQDTIEGLAYSSAVYSTDNLFAVCRVSKVIGPIIDPIYLESGLDLNKYTFELSDPEFLVAPVKIEKRLKERRLFRRNFPEFTKYSGYF